MKKHTLLLIGLLSLFLFSCSTNKTVGSDKLYNSNWELEFITGLRITFEGLFPEKKPVINLNKSTKMATGNSGCNGYLSKFSPKGNTISFAQPEMSTMMYCGQGETTFRKTMLEVDNYRIVNDKLEFLKGDIVLMRFKRLKI
ncbi:MAG: META domain-containing protein [Pelobium sp.]